MACKVLLDANVVLDFVLKREHYSVSKEIIQLAVNREIEAFITPSIVHIVAYWLSKTYGRKQAKQIILLLLNDITVIDATHDVVLKAVYSLIDDTEDALQYFTGLHHKMDYLLSRDKIFIKNALPTLPIYTPEQFLKQVSNSSK